MAGSRRKKIENRRIVRLAFLVTVLLLSLLFAKTCSLHKKRTGLLRQEELFESILAEEESKNEELNEAKERTLTEEEIYEIARQRLGLLFPDEILLIPEDP